MSFYQKKSENNNPRFNILLHTQSIVCATVDSQWLECLGYITLGQPWFETQVNSTHGQINVT